MGAATSGGSASEDEPYWLGLIVDVSLSMFGPLVQAGGGNPQSRLDSVRDALDSLIVKAQSAYNRQTDAEDVPRMKVFALGFGFRSTRRPQPDTIADGRVRDLLPVLAATAEPIIEVEELTRTWPAVKTHLGWLGLGMLGPSSPLAEALEVAAARLQRAGAATAQPGGARVFIVTDGEPSGERAAARVKHLAAQLRSAGVTVMTCLLSETGVGKPRCLYGSPAKRWPAEARLMFECSSVLAADDPIRGYLAELRWTIEPSARLFTAIDNYDDLSTYLNTTLSLLGVRPSHDELTHADQRVGSTYNIIHGSTIYGPVAQAGGIDNLTVYPPSP